MAITPLSMASSGAQGVQNAQMAQARGQQVRGMQLSNAQKAYNLRMLQIESQAYQRAMSGGGQQPGAAQPGAAQPGAAQPGAAQPGAAQPGGLGASAAGNVTAPGRAITPAAQKAQGQLGSAASGQNAYSSGGPPPNSPGATMYHTMINAAEKMAQGGDGVGAMKTLMNAENFRMKELSAGFKAAQTASTSLKTQQSQINMLAQQLSTVHDQASYEAWRQGYQQATGHPAPMQGVPYSPQIVQSLRMMGESINNQINQHLHGVQLAQDNMRVQQAQARLELDRKRLSLIQDKTGIYAKEVTARIKTEEANLKSLQTYRQQVGQAQLERGQYYAAHARGTTEKPPSSNMIMSAGALLQQKGYSDPHGYGATQLAMRADYYAAQGMGYQQALDKAYQEATTGKSGFILQGKTITGMGPATGGTANAAAQASPVEPAVTPPTTQSFDQGQSGATVANAQHFVGQGGSHYTRSEIEQAAKNVGMSVEEYARTYNLAPQ